MSRLQFATFDIFFLDLNFFIFVKSSCLLLILQFLKFVSFTIDFLINVRLNASFLLRISLYYCENKKIKCTCSSLHRFALLSC